jgi:hypothetical protein
MTDSYFVFKNNQEEGPFTLEEVMETGLDVDTMVLSPLADDWQRASDLPEFFEYFEAKGLYFPTEDNLATFWTLFARQAKCREAWVKGYAALWWLMPMAAGLALLKRFSATWASLYRVWYLALATSLFFGTTTARPGTINLPKPTY